MPQGPLVAAIATKSGSNSLGILDTLRMLMVSRGGVSSSLNNTAAGVVKASPGRIAKIIIVAPGSGSGSFTINDCTTTGAATAANEVFTVLYSATAAGTVYDLDWPCANGITISAVPGAGSPIINVSYT